MSVLAYGQGEERQVSDYSEHTSGRGEETHNNAPKPADSTLELALGERMTCAS